MAYDELPASAAWRHQDARDGFESVFLRTEPSGYEFDGYTAAVEGGYAWVVRYEITLDERWHTRSARVWGRSSTGEHEVHLVADGEGHWQVDAVRAPALDGCFDVDLESSSFTNTFPVHRLRLDIGERADAPAAYVRALDLGVERLEQHYLRVEDDSSHQRYDYVSPGLDFECRLVYDESGLLLEYPGIASRVL